MSEGAEQRCERAEWCCGPTCGGAEHVVGEPHGVVREPAISDGERIDICKYRATIT